MVCQENFQLLFFAVSSAERLKLLELILNRGEMFVQEMRPHFPYFSDGGFHANLKILYDHKVLLRRRDGIRIYYRVNKTFLRATFLEVAELFKEEFLNVTSKNISNNPKSD